MLDYSIANDSATWGQFGDYMGGSLNPLLSFITIILLIKSLNFEKESNIDLREQIQDNKKAEKLKSFSILFFNLISSQKLLLDNFTITSSEQEAHLPSGVETIIYIENKIEKLRENGANNEEIKVLISEVDQQDRIYSILRAFYITVKITTDKLSNTHNFTEIDRKDHLLTLIHLTDFTHLRLIILAMQFTDYPASQYLRNNSEFTAVLKEVGMDLDLY